MDPETIQMLRELIDNQMMIVADADREFLLGLYALLETGEDILALHAPRVRVIFSEYQRNQFL
jgi:hypothetical protein